MEEGRMEEERVEEGRMDGEKMEEEDGGGEDGGGEDGGKYRMTVKGKRQEDGTYRKNLILRVMKYQQTNYLHMK